MQTCRYPLFHININHGHLAVKLNITQGRQRRNMTREVDGIHYHDSLQDYQFASLEASRRVECVLN